MLRCCGLCRPDARVFATVKGKGMAEPVLVVVFLRGGADGLGLVSPASDPNFIAARPADLRVARSGDGAGHALAQTIADVDFRCHPAAAPLADLCRAGDLSLIHAAGLTRPSPSAPPRRNTTTRTGSASPFPFTAAKTQVSARQRPRLRRRSPHAHRHSDRAIGWGP